MAEFPQFRYTMGDVRRAGEALRGQILWCDDSAEEIKEIFRIANNWRDSHMYPMQRIRHEVIGQIRRLKQNGKTFARVKRMASIRRKLRNLPQGLNQIQDLGGCRAILPAMKEAQALINSCRENLAHGVHNVDDYIKEPKPDGYRSYHIVYKFFGKRYRRNFQRPPHRVAGQNSTAALLGHCSRGGWHFQGRKPQSGSGR
jgi:hypothetical protein